MSISILGILMRHWEAGGKAAVAQVLRDDGLHERGEAPPDARAAHG